MKYKYDEKEYNERVSIMDDCFSESITYLGRELTAEDRKNVLSILKKYRDAFGHSESKMDNSYTKGEKTTTDFYYKETVSEFKLPLEINKYKKSHVNIYADKYFDFESRHSKEEMKELYYIFNLPMPGKYGLAVFNWVSEYYKNMEQLFEKHKIFDEDYIRAVRMAVIFTYFSTMYDKALFSRYYMTHSRIKSAFHDFLMLTNGKNFSLNTDTVRKATILFEQKFVPNYYLGTDEAPGLGDLFEKTNVVEMFHMNPGYDEESGEKVKDRSKKLIGLTNNNSKTLFDLREKMYIAKTGERRYHDVFTDGTASEIDSYAKHNGALLLSLVERLYEEVKNDERVKIYFTDEAKLWRQKELSLATINPDRHIDSFYANGSVENPFLGKQLSQLLDLNVEHIGYLYGLSLFPEEIKEDKNGVPMPKLCTPATTYDDEMFERSYQLLKTFAYEPLVEQYLMEIELLDTFAEGEIDAARFFAELMKLHDSETPLDINLNCEKVAYEMFGMDCSPYALNDFFSTTLRFDTILKKGYAGIKKKTQEEIEAEDKAAAELSEKIRKEEEIFAFNDRWVKAINSDNPQDYTDLYNEKHGTNYTTEELDALEDQEFLDKYNEKFGTNITDVAEMQTYIYTRWNEEHGTKYTNYSDWYFDNDEIYLKNLEIMNYNTGVLERRYKNMKRNMAIDNFKNKLSGIATRVRRAKELREIDKEYKKRWDK